MTATTLLVEALPASDYSALPADLASRQRDRAARIVGLYRRSVEAFGEIGRELLAAYARRWLGERITVGQATADNTS